MKIAHAMMVMQVMKIAHAMMVVQVMKTTHTMKAVVQVRHKGGAGQEGRAGHEGQEVMKVEKVKKIRSGVRSGGPRSRDQYLSWRTLSEMRIPRFFIVHNPR